MQRIRPDYDPSVQHLHTLELALQALDEIGPGLRTKFVHMLAFDAWIGNGDRHQMNWGVIDAQGSSPRLAPAFDLGSCLGSELLDEKVAAYLAEPASLDRYVDRCGSGFGDGTKDLIGMEELVRQLRGLPEWRSNAHAWCAKFADAEGRVRRYLGCIPTFLVSRGRRCFMLETISRRLSWLKGVL